MSISSLTSRLGRGAALDSDLVALVEGDLVDCGVAAVADQLLVGEAADGCGC